MSSAFRQLFSRQPDTSSNRNNSDHAIVAESSSSPKPLSSDAFSAADEPRHSKENFQPKINAGRVQSKQLDLGNPTASQRADLGTTFHVDENSAEPRIMSSGALPPRMQEASNFVKAQHGGAARHAEWLELQDNFVDIATRIHSTFKLKLEDGDDLSELELALQELQVFAKKTRHWHDESDLIDHGTQASAKPSNTPSPWQWFKRSDDAKSVPPSADIEDVPDAQSFESAGIEEDYAPLYYKYASAVRYLSDDLINLGPPPVDNARHAAEDSDDDVDSEVLSPQEYAEQHLELLKEIDDARKKAAKYKQLCFEHGIKLDGDSDDGDFDHDVDSQSEDVYRSILSEREFGTSRIDSVLAVQARQLPSTFPIASSRAVTASRTAEWAASQDVPNVDEVIASPQSTGIWTPPMTSIEDNVSLNDTANEISTQVTKNIPARRALRSSSTPASGTSLPNPGLMHHRRTRTASHAIENETPRDLVQCPDLSIAVHN